MDDRNVFLFEHSWVEQWQSVVRVIGRISVSFVFTSLGCGWFGFVSKPSWCLRCPSYEMWVGAKDTWINQKQLLKKKPLAQHSFSSCWASMEQKRTLEKTDFYFLAAWFALACELLIILRSSRLRHFPIKHMLIVFLSLDLNQHPVLLDTVQVK